MSAQQGRNNRWLGGLDVWASPPFGGIQFEFTSGDLVVTTEQSEIGFYRTSANITSVQGILRFSTNGAFLGDLYGDTLFNGQGISPCNYTSNYPNGLVISQGSLILPRPEHPEGYYLLHGSLDNEMNSTAQHLYLSTVDMNLNGGLGAVVTKNEILIDDVLNAGRITAVRHANGRDWWAFCHKSTANEFYRLLVTPNGVSVDGTQSIGIVRPPDHGQVCFSPDGSKFAYYWGIEDLEIFDFDRCTGLFSNPLHISIDDFNQMGGVAFSPNGRYLYVSSVLDVYQVDTEASDVAGSIVNIAHWDGFYSPAPPFATDFDIAQLAPDGKVYIGTGNGTQHLHVINNPDLAGLACNMVQHGVELPRWYSNSLPNHPNYHLGPVLGSVCDSLGMGLQELQAPLAPVQASPNPSSGRVTLTYGAQRTAGLLQVWDAEGRMVQQEKLPAWSTVHALELAGQPAGMYHCRLQWGARSATVRVIFNEP